MFCVRGRRVQWRQLWRRHKTLEMTRVTMMKTHKITTISANTPDTGNDSLAEDTWNSDSEGEYTRQEIKAVTQKTLDTWNEDSYSEYSRNMKWHEMTTVLLKAYEITTVTANTLDTWNDDSLAEGIWNNDSYSEHTRHMKWRQSCWRHMK